MHDKDILLGGNLPPSQTEQVIEGETKEPKAMKRSGKPVK
jgi:hypothetical protein